MAKFTAFCQQSNGHGTIWISTVEAESVEAAIGQAVADCASDWGYDESDVHCLGLAAGDVDILCWEDIGD